MVAQAALTRYEKVRFLYAPLGVATQSNAHPTHILRWDDGTSGRRRFFHTIFARRGVKHGYGQNLPVTVKRGK